jgi:hypothetical protein
MAEALTFFTGAFSTHHMRSQAISGKENYRNGESERKKEKEKEKGQVVRQSLTPLSRCSG